MVGRAGRPQYNDKGYACVYVKQDRKNFYRRYINDPFPIESQFEKSLLSNINAEIAAHTIQSRQDCFDYLTWSYYFIRIARNPDYYNTTLEGIKDYLINLIN